MRPRAPAQNQQTRELISTEKMSHKRHSNKDSCVCVPSFARQCQSDKLKSMKNNSWEKLHQYLSSGDLSFIVNPFHCTGGEVWHDEVEGLGQVSVNKTKSGMMTWPGICQQDKVRHDDLAWYLSTRQSQAWWLGLVSVNKTVRHDDLAQYLSTRQSQAWWLGPVSVNNTKAWWNGRTWPGICQQDKVRQDEVEGLGLISVNKTRSGMMTWPGICQQDKGMMKWKDMAWYLSTRQSQAWWLGLVSVNKTKSCMMTWPGICQQDKVRHDDLAWYLSTRQSQAWWSGRTWPYICQQDKVRHDYLVWYLSTTQSQAWWLGLVSINKTKSGMMTWPGICQQDKVRLDDLAWYLSITQSKAWLLGLVSVNNTKAW